MLVKIPNTEKRSLLNDLHHMVLCPNGLSYLPLEQIGGLGGTQVPVLSGYSRKVGKHLKVEVLWFSHPIFPGSKLV